MEGVRSFLFSFYQNAKYAILPLFIFAILLAGCDDGSELECFGTKAFSPIPECVTDYLVTATDSITCNRCIPEDEGKSFSLTFFIPSPNQQEGWLSSAGESFTWEQVDCTTIFLSNEGSQGTFEEMEVPEEGSLEFIPSSFPRLLV
jgi:hypothetical protein